MLQYGDHGDAVGYLIGDRPARSWRLTYMLPLVLGRNPALGRVKDSKVIVAINKDAEAKIFGVTGYGLVGICS